MFFGVCKVLSHSFCSVVWHGLDLIEKDSTAGTDYTQWALLFAYISFRYQCSCQSKSNLFTLMCAASIFMMMKWLQFKSNLSKVGIVAINQVVYTQVLVFTLLLPLLVYTIGVILMGSCMFLPICIRNPQQYLLLCMIMQVGTFVLTAWSPTLSQVIIYKGTTSRHM